MLINGIKYACLFRQKHVIQWSFYPIIAAAIISRELYKITSNIWIST
ncbi:hypothetical protein [Bacillus sp. FJAT-50079]|nr:hypothetical protein [Bacillus sp. FJAT-50079]MBS4206676.1 hypothetical protein [Bacillus sp. FJAT-50079]